MTTTAPLAQARIPYTACPLCDARQIEKLVTADCSKHPLYNPAIPATMTWMKCDMCNHVFTDGHYTDEAYKIVFSKTNENQKVGFDMERQRFVSAKIIEKVTPHAPDTGRWMDIGFGNGSLLFTAHEYGYTPVGIDLREDNVKQLKAMDIEAYCVDMNVLDHPGRYSVISMADVLEHVPFPKTCLNSVHKLLKAGGVLFLSMPNMDSFLFESLTKAGINPFWGELEHFHNFGRPRLYDLLRECGFEPVQFGVSERYRACMEVIAKKK